MKIIWKGGTLRGGMTQWMLFGIVAVAIGLVAFVLVALGLVVGVALVAILSVVTALASRRRRNDTSVYAVRTTFDKREPEGDCVELDKDAYTVRIVDEKGRPPEVP